MGEPTSSQIPVDEDPPQLTPPQFGTPEFFQRNLELVRNVVAQAMGSMPAPQVVVNAPMPSAPLAPPPTTNTGIQFRFGADPRQFSSKSEDARPYVYAINERLNSSLAPIMTQRDKVTYFSSWLSSGAPQRWHHSIVQSKSHLLNDYEGYVKAFNDHFLDPHEATVYRQKLEAMKQDRDVQRYAAMFREYTALAGVDEKTKWNCFFRGLKQDIQKALNVGQGAPTSFEKLVEYALNIDNFNHMIEGTNSGARAQQKGSNNNFPAAAPASSAAPSSSVPTPMEIDTAKVRLVNGRILPGERERRKKNNLCLYCGQPGHIIATCPVCAQKSAEKGAASSSSSSGKPPLQA